LLKEAKDSLENEKLKEGVLSRPVTVKEEMPPENDYIPTVSVCDNCTFLFLAYP